MTTPPVAAVPPAELLLAQGFPDTDHSYWQELVAAALNRGRADDRKLDGPGAEAKLRTTSVDGLVIDCLYDIDCLSDIDGDIRPLGHPGVMPFTRGSGWRPADVPWGVRALYDDPDPKVTRRAVLDDLEHGVTSLWIEVGDHAVRADELGEVLSDVLLDLAPIAVTSATDQAAAADSLRAVWKDRGLLRRQARGHLGLDPLGHAARTGTAPEPGPMLAAAADCLADYPEVRAAVVDLRPYHEAGAGDVDEVAFAVATGVDYLRLLEGHGIGADDAFSQLSFRVNATADEFLTIAKLRAMRRLWARVGQECGVPEQRRGARVHAVTSRRMYSRDDPYVNMLRATIACFGAAAGAAEIITVLPFDEVVGLPDAFSRRVARNTQIVLAEESNVGRVLDPAGGSWYVEALTDELARAAWGVFQQIEAGGGMSQTLADGVVHERIEATATERHRRLSTRTLPLTGVSMFPQLGETPLRRPPRSTPRVEVSTDGPGPLIPRRDAEIFEAMRDRSAAHAEVTGAPPPVFLACLGTRRDFGARETFTTSLLAVAGLDAPRSEGGTVDEIGAKAREARARVAVMCSSAKCYAESGQAVAAALRQAGVERLYLAGQASELGEAAGIVDGTMSVGMDVVAELSRILDFLGAPDAPPAEGELPVLEAQAPVAAAADEATRSTEATTHKEQR